MMPIQNTEQTITGTVTVIDWDEDDNPLEIAISVITLVQSEDEDEEVTEMQEDYVVGDTKKGRELMDHIDEEVEATGTVKTNEDDIN
ncbi:MAG: hypothetical protein DWQ10_04115, partial [Calditrichaeota bacterium]